MTMTCLINSTTTIAHQQKQTHLGTEELEREALRCASKDPQILNSTKNEPILVNNYGVSFLEI